MIEPKSSLGSLHILSIGPFGRAVAQYLKMFRALVETVLTGETIMSPTVCSKVTMNIIASWRPVPQLCESLDELSFTRQQPFVPAIVDSSVLRVGPVVIPGSGSCWACWSRRHMQHDSWLEERLVLASYYESHPSAGPQGYLEPFAMIAASQLASVVAAIESSSAIAGRIWQIDMITREMTTATVIGIHDCPRCGFRQAADRSFAAMRRDLAYLWEEGSERR